ncbi:hypothetical protein niasHT_003467 [Heterodera trifolii]|uniref:Uncharacterized protein n=1 Tax=Heterodera trifolii TaxID=157864 RepID=A0ABD2M4M8_9BILA
MVVEPISRPNPTPAFPLLVFLTWRSCPTSNCTAFWETPNCSPIAHKKQSRRKAALSADSIRRKWSGQATVRSRMLAQGRALRERIGCEGNQNRTFAGNAFGLRRNEGACENEFGRLSAPSVNLLERSGYGGRAEQEQFLVERLADELVIVRAERDEAEAKADHIKLLEKTAKSRAESKAIESEMKVAKEKLEMAEEENAHFSILSVQQNLMAQEQGQKIKALMEEVEEMKAKNSGKEEEFPKKSENRIAEHKESVSKLPLKLNIVKKSNPKITKPKKISQKPEAEKCNIRPLNSIIFRKPTPQFTPNYRPPKIQAGRQLIAIFHRHAPGRRICEPGGD